MAKHLQFLVDQQNSNYERIRTWSGSYDEINKHHFSTPNSSIGDSNPAEYMVFKDLFTFSCDLVKDKCFMRLERVADQYYDKKGAKVQPGLVRVESDLACILTSDVYYQYDFGHDQMRGELEGVMPQRLGKVCISMPADQQRDVSRVGTMFDPRFFFYAGRDKKHPLKNWGNIEQGFVPWLKGEWDDVMQKRALTRLRVWRGEFDGVIWYRVVYYEENGVDLRDEYVFNSAANYNMVLSSECDYGVPFLKFHARYVSDSGIYFPEKYLLEHGKGKEFRYFDLIDVKFNEKIPDEQFTLQALGIEDGGVVLDDAKATSFKYENGGLTKLGKYGETPDASNVGAFWRSPRRIVAVVLGLALIAFGIVRRYRGRATVDSNEID